MDSGKGFSSFSSHWPHFHNDRRHIDAIQHCTRNVSHRQSIAYRIPLLWESLPSQARP
jgi:hypothetical protein